MNVFRRGSAGLLASLVAGMDQVGESMGVDGALWVAQCHGSVEQDGQDQVDDFVGEVSSGHVL